MIRSLFLLLALRLVPVDNAVPNRQPQLATSGGVVALAYGSGHAIWFSRSADNGNHFSPPVLVGEGPQLALGRHRGPRVAFSGKTIVVSAIDGDLMAWRSTDGGVTWSKPVMVNDVPSSAHEGLHAMASDSAGGLAAVWLDLRAKGTRLYGAFSHDGGATWSKNVLVYESPEGTICQCCHPSIAAVAPGEFAVMWRNSLGGMRDMYVLRVRDGAVESAAQKLGTGAWKLEACPMDGGGIAIAKDRIVTAWRRESTIYVAEAGQPETPLGQGKDVAIAIGKKGRYAAWVGASGIEVQAPGAASPMKLGEKGAFLVLTALSDGSVLAAWEENGAIVTQQLK